MLSHSLEFQKGARYVQKMQIYLSHANNNGFTIFFIRDIRLCLFQSNEVCDGPELP